MNLAVEIVGYAAAVCMIFGYLPQAIATIRTRDTDGIALPTFLMLGLGSVLFVVQGLMLDNIPLVITNSITTICSVIVFGIKISNDRKRKRISEDPVVDRSIRSSWLLLSSIDERRLQGHDSAEA